MTSSNRVFGNYIRRFGLVVVTQRLEGIAVMQVSENERLEFPFGVAPDVSVEPQDPSIIHDLLTEELYTSSLPTRRRTSSLFAIISRVNR